MTTSTIATKKATTAVNYDEKTTALIVSTMQGVKNHADQVAAIIGLMLSTGKNKRSLTAKISNLSRDVSNGITFYGVEKNTTKTGGKVQSKSAKIGIIANLMDCEQSEIESLEKGTKIALDLVITALSPKLSDES